MNEASNDDPVHLEMSIMSSASLIKERTESNCGSTISGVWGDGLKLSLVEGDELAAVLVVLGGTVRNLRCISCRREANQHLISSVNGRLNRWDV